MVEASERDALAAQVFPREWAAAVTETGPRARNKRHGLRRRAEVALRLRELRAQGASCASCRAFARYPHGKGHVCDDGSSGGAYQMTSADNLCADWRHNGQRLNPGVGT